MEPFFGAAQDIVVFLSFLSIYLPPLQQKNQGRCPGFRFFLPVLWQNVRR